VPHVRLAIAIIALALASAACNETPRDAAVESPAPAPTRTPVPPNRADITKAVTGFYDDIVHYRPDGYWTRTSPAFRKAYPPRAFLDKFIVSGFPRSVHVDNVRGRIADVTVVNVRRSVTHHGVGLIYHQRGSLLFVHGSRGWLLDATDWHGNDLVAVTNKDKILRVTGVERLSERDSLVHVAGLPFQLRLTVRSDGGWSTIPVVATEAPGDRRGRIAVVPCTSANIEREYRDVIAVLHEVQEHNMARLSRLNHMVDKIWNASVDCPSLGPSPIAALSKNSVEEYFDIVLIGYTESAFVKMLLKDYGESRRFVDLYRATIPQLRSVSVAQGLKRWIAYEREMTPLINTIDREVPAAL